MTEHEYREKLAKWMIEMGFATGHGDTFEDLLDELRHEINDLRRVVGVKKKKSAEAVE